MSYVLRTIEAFPRGRTTGELLSLLDVQHDSRKRLEILREIEGLSRQGVIRVGRDMKWRSIVRTPAPAETALSDADPPRAGASEAYLRAIPAKFGSRALQSAELEVGESFADRPSPNALLRYYRSALRADLLVDVAEVLALRQVVEVDAVDPVEGGRCPGDPAQRL